MANEELKNSSSSINYYRSHPFSKQRLEQVKKYKSQYQKISLSEQKVFINENLISLQYIKNKIKAYSLDPGEVIKNLENIHILNTQLYREVMEEWNILWRL